MARKIVVIGSLNLDMVARVKRLPGPGETVAARAFESAPGGKGANQAVACARLGAAVQMIGRVGVDLYGEQLRSETARSGVDVTCVEAVEGAPTGLALITVDDTAQNSITIVAGANERLTREEVKRHEDLIRSAAIVLAQLETPMETVVALARMAYEAGVPFVLDPAPASALPAGLLALVTWLTPNESESRVLLEVQDFGEPAEIAEALLRTGCRNVALKLGASGVFLAGADVSPAAVRAYSVGAVDSTAAGDAFNGAFAVALSEGMAPLTAARFACAAAGISVTRHGAARSMPTRAEVENFLAANGSVSC